MWPLLTLNLDMSTVANTGRCTKQKQKQNGKQCRSWWDGLWRAIWSESTLFAKVSILVCRAERIMVNVLPDPLQKLRGERVKLISYQLQLKLYHCLGRFQQMKNWYFSYFSQKTGFDISCKLSPKETICMKCLILFSGKNMKNISNVVRWKFYPEC